MAQSRTLLAATALATVASMASFSGQAAAAICPVFAGSTGACDLVFNFNSDGSITTTGAGGSSIGGEDAEIGVVNNTSSTLTSFTLVDTGNVGIYGFDGDGIDVYSGVGPVAGNPDITTYGGPDGYFTNLVGNSGVVNFVNGIAPGGTDYFSLEEAISLSAPPTATGPVTTGPTGSTTVPEPASMALLGAGLFGIGFVRRRLRS